MQSLIEGLLETDCCLRIDLRCVPNITIFIKNKDGIAEIDRLLTLYEATVRKLFRPSLEQDCYQHVKYMVNIYTKKLYLEWYENYPLIGPTEFGSIFYSREQMRELLQDIASYNIKFVKL
nr:hypothetical protein Clen_358 [Cedratvirus lena]